ncbi:MAG: alpha/beta fold hydrolase [Proteobacteria bacterium]|nr:alpha/beta fold hydrolase [Pseudomonadota bacterium]
MAQAMEADWSTGALSLGRSCAPAFAEQRFGLPAGSFPFASRLLHLNNCQLHLVDEGRGPVLLFLHGNPTWSFQFRHLIRTLRGSYRCIALDLPGFGLSTAPPGFSFKPRDAAPLVAAAMRDLDLRDATLVAHDWGGPIGLAAMAEEPGRIRRIVLGNTWAWPVNGDFHFEWFSRLMGGPVGRWANLRFMAFVTWFMPMAMRRRRLAAMERAAYRAPFADATRRVPLHVFPSEIVGAGPWLAEVERVAAAFDGPVQLLWPDRDVAFRRRELAHWRSLWPRARVAAIERCGHFLWEEAPDDCLAAMVPFLESTARLERE